MYLINIYKRELTPFHNKDDNKEKILYLKNMRLKMKIKIIMVFF